MEFNMVEIVGYAASVFVAISLMMTNVAKLRWINMTGCLLFVVYGSIIEAWPVALMNAFCVGINVYNLVKLNRAKQLQTA